MTAYLVQPHLISSLATSRRRSIFRFQAAIGVLQRLQPENLVNLLGDLAIKRELRRDKNGVRQSRFAVAIAERKPYLRAS